MDNSRKIEILEKKIKDLENENRELRAAKETLANGLDVQKQEAKIVCEKNRLAEETYNNLCKKYREMISECDKLHGELQEELKKGKMQNAEIKKWMKKKFKA